MRPDDAEARRLEWEATLQLVDDSTPYGLTGAVFGTDDRAIVEADHALRYTAGNLTINDKPTGAVVGQQPFGGARASGTNDKIGSRVELDPLPQPAIGQERRKGCQDAPRAAVPGRHRRHP